MRKIFFDNYGARLWFVLTVIMVGVVMLIAVFSFVGVALDRHFSQQSCEARAELIGTETYSWQDFTFFDYGCYNVSEKGTTSDNYQRVLIEAD